jgi:mono/diheme cytochrome c family protein
MRKRIGSCGIAVLAIALLTACPADEPAPRDPAVREPAPPAGAPPALDPQIVGELPAGVTAQMAASGQQLYGTVCVACHGPAGAGTPLGPALNDQDWIHIGGEFQEIVEITRVGVARPLQYPAPMPPMGGGNYTQEQLQAIGAYVYALSHGHL